MDGWIFEIPSRMFLLLYTIPALLREHFHYCQSFTVNIKFPLKLQIMPQKGPYLSTLSLVLFIVVSVVILSGHDNSTV